MHLKGLYDCKDCFCTQINFVPKTLSSFHTYVVSLHDFLLYADFSCEIYFSKSLFLGGHRQSVQTHIRRRLCGV